VKHDSMNCIWSEQKNAHHQPISRMPTMRKFVVVRTVLLAALVLAIGCRTKSSNSDSGQRNGKADTGLTVADSSRLEPKGGAREGEQADTSAESYLRTTTIHSSCFESVRWLSSHPDTCSHTLESSGWALKAFKRFGSVGGPAYYYGRYTKSGPNGDTPSGAGTRHFILIFESPSDQENVSPVLAISGSEFFDEELGNPTLTETAAGLLLHVFMTTGNGGWDFGCYLIHSQGEWKEVSVPNWSKVFLPYVPDSCWFCRGGEIDLTNMKAVFSVFNPSDACCCPSGGTVIGELAVTGTKLFVKAAHYFPHKLNGK